MPKLKTKQKAAKRFRVTKNGKVLARASGRRHLMGCKPPKRRRQMRKVVSMVGGVSSNVKKSMPYMA